MKGRILGYNANEYRGLIAGQDGQRYDFVRIDWHGRGEPAAGMEVDFQTDSGKARDIYQVVAQQPAPAPPPPQYSPTYTPAYGQPGPGYGQPPQPPYGQPQQPYSYPQPPYGQPQQFYAPPGGRPLDMDFPQAVRICFEKYATFSGRARRAEYWWFYLFTIVLRIVTGILDSAIQHGDTRFAPFGVIGFLAILLPWLAAWTRRMHDTNRSGFWVLGFCIAMFGLAVGLGIGLAMQADTHSDQADIMVGLFGLALVGVVIWSIVMLCFKGTDGTNRYGPDPLHPTADVF